MADFSRAALPWPARMTEIELKFQVPPEQRDAVHRAVATRTAQRIGLRALYFDTADRALASAGLALRVRKEGRRWVQTLKGAGDGVWQRLEHEVALRVRAGTQPLADPALHDGTPAGQALRSALAAGSGALQGIYGTQVTRTRRLLRAPGCLVELAFDEGALTAQERRWPLCELEFELKGGDATALVAVAARWATRFGLTLDTRTKAERGDRLARSVRLGAPVKAQALALPVAPDAATALRAMVGNCLVQILGNASELAHEVDTPPEHLHQLRVGLRRLRSVLHELHEALPQARPEWSQALAQVFGRLGSARDRDALAQTLLPALRAAGAAGLQLPEFSPTTRRTLAKVLPHFASQNNPLDVTGQAAVETEMYEGALEALANDPSVGLIAFDAFPPRLEGETPWADPVLRTVARLRRETGVVFASVAMSPLAYAPAARSFTMKHALPFLQGRLLETVAPDGRRIRLPPPAVGTRHLEEAGGVLLHPSG